MIKVRSALFLAPALALAGLLTTGARAVDHDGHGHDEKKEAQRDEAHEVAVGKEVPKTIALTDIDGKVHTLADYRGKVLVLDFWSIQCPWSIAYEARLKELTAAYADKQVVVLAIDSNHTELAREEDDPYVRIRAYAKKAEVPYPILIDENNVIADLFKAKTTPHLYVIDAKGVLRYTGAIDDDPKNEKTEVTHYAANAIDAVLAGRAVEVSSTKPVGCSIKRVGKDKKKGKKKEAKRQKTDA